MSTREESSEVADPRIPKGYKVTYHELRGYDSPDRWFEAHCGARKLGDFGTREQAIAACTVRAERKPMRVGSVQTLRPWKLRVHRSNDRVTLHYGDKAIPLSYEGAEELRNLLEKADSDG
jgi:hypothetical protein